MQSIAISEFRAHMQRYLRLVGRGEELVITSRGQEVARMMPPHTYQKTAQKKLKQLRITCKIGDVLSPLNTKWKADQ